MPNIPDRYNTESFMDLTEAWKKFIAAVDASCIADLDEEGQKAAILCLERQQIDVINK